ncbi:MAG: RNase adapter RapZ [Alphaproteobacteria bacterium]
MQKPKERFPLILVTGMSGAGHSTALKILEDLGFEAIDNLPLALLEPLLQQHFPAQPKLAIGIDIRTHDFAPQELENIINRIKQQKVWEPYLLFLDCKDEVLLRRYEGSRRRHPLGDASLQESLIKERKYIAPLKSLAKFVADTSDISMQGFVRLVQQYFSGFTEIHPLSINIISFSYRRGIPLEADLIFDGRFLPNPFYNPILCELTGHDTAVFENLQAATYWQEASPSLRHFIKYSLKGFHDNCRSYVTIACGCTGGRHRSVFMAEQIAEWLKEEGETATVIHRDVLYR